MYTHEDQVPQVLAWEWGCNVQSAPSRPACREWVPRLRTTGIQTDRHCGKCSEGFQSHGFTNTKTNTFCSRDSSLSPWTASSCWKVNELSTATCITVTFVSIFLGWLFPASEAFPVHGLAWGRGAREWLWAHWSHWTDTEVAEELWRSTYCGSLQVSGNCKKVR